MKPTLTMILAGGRGKRMDIFCEQRPKPILPFAGNHQVIDLALNNCVQSQISSLAVLVDYQRSLMSDYLNQWSFSHRGSCCVSILPPQSGSYNGTANAVFQNLEYLENQNHDTILILAGDHIYDMDYRQILSFHDQKQADVTVAITQIPLGEAHRFGTLTIDLDGRIKQFVEKSSTPLSNLASMGIYVFNRRFLIEKLKQDAQNPNSPHDFGYAILPELVKQDRVFGFKFEEYWQDIGTVESYYQANLQMLAGTAGFKIENNHPSFNLPEQLAVSTINVPGFIVNSIVSPGCVIQGYVENSILSPGVWIGEKARVVDSIIMANSRISHHSVIDRCILDEGVDVDKYCYVGFGSSSRPQSNEITLVGKDVSLGPNTTIGKKSKLMPGLRLSDSNYRFVAPGTVLPALV
jgi:glucose-1-phosphate adenylyltransferase